MRLILDITRILLRRGNAAPTGIDRVEFAYLSRLIANPQYPDVHFVVSTHVGCGIVPKATVRRLYNEISARWAPHIDVETHARFTALVGDLQKPIDRSRVSAARYGSNRRDSWSASRHAKLVPLALRGWLKLFKLLVEARRVPTYYFHGSHVCLEHPYIFNWTRGGHIKPIFFLHDIIPIDYPEYCGENAYRKHLQRITTAASLGTAIVVNSDYTKERLERFFEVAGLPGIPVVVSWLGTEVPAEHEIELVGPAVPYFVHVGTIEPRKNIHQLLNVWRAMLATDGPERTPRLIIAGRRGWKSQNVFDVLDKGHELAGHVSEVSDLNDAELATLVRGSVGVLAPSLVEGFGLTGAEALGRGVPVVASDIPAHREVLGDAAILLNPIDGMGWADAIRGLAWSEEFRRERIEATRRFQPRSWDDHVDMALARAMEQISNQ